MKKIAILLIGVLTISSLIAQPSFLGLTNQGGAHLKGNVFSYDQATITHNTKYSSSSNGGFSNFPALIEFNGKLYGLSKNGGTGSGSIYSHDIATGKQREIITLGVANPGYLPYGGLTLVGNKMYGITAAGGANYDGVIFEFDPITEVYTVLFEFDETPHGAAAHGTLLLANDGKLYGVNESGAANGYGCLFSFDVSTSTFVKHLDFGGAFGGRGQAGDLIQAANGLLYGLTKSKGLGGNGSGCIFSYNTSTQVSTILHTFSSPYGSPENSLYEASNGLLYGIANGIFSFNTSSNTLSILEPSITTQSTSFIEASPNKLISLSTYEKVHEYDISTDTYSVKLSSVYNSVNNGYSGNTFNHGGVVYGGRLIKATNGKVYGCTYNGGLAGQGALLEYDYGTNTITKKVDFGVIELSLPKGSLIKASNGKFYGMSEKGGTHNYGTLYEYDRNLDEITILINFKDTLGTLPKGKLLQASNGKLYGLTMGGGTFSGSYKAVLFSYDITTNTYEVKQEGPIASEGSLIEATNGKLYALTATFNGDIIEYDIALDTLIIKKQLYSGGNTPKAPHGSLLQATNGLLYGVTAGGGTWGKGTFFSYDPLLDTIIVIKAYHQNIGFSPNGTPIQASADKIYFTNYDGGSADDGTMEEYTISTNTVVTKFNFNSSVSGKWPSGEITLASDGNIYGLTSNNSNASIYKYAPGSTNASTQYAFANGEGSSSINNGLVEFTPNITSLNNTLTTSSLTIFPNPTDGILNIKSNEEMRSITVYSVVGHQVINKQMKTKQDKVNLNHLPKGVYFINVAFEKGILSKKVVLD